MGNNFEQLSEDDFQEYKIAFGVIEHLEQSDKIKAGAKSSFTVVRNYLANAIAQYAINIL